MKLLTALCVISCSVMANDFYVSSGDKEIILKGQDGHHGGYVFSCSDGEDGTDGQSGGDVNIYYSAKSELNEIFLDLSGGKGGSGSNASIYNNNCDDELDKLGRRDNRLPLFYDGKDGRDGSYGNIRLIKKSDKLSYASSYKSSELKDFLENTVSLKRHLFETHQGARKLFKADSKISDSYQEYLRTEEKTVELFTTLELGAEELKTKFSIALDNKSVKLNSSQAIMQYTVTQNDEQIQVELTEFLSKKSLDQIRFIGHQGEKEEFEIILEDPSTSIKELKNSYFVEMYLYSNFIERYVILDLLSLKDNMIRFEGDKVFLKLGAFKKSFVNDFKAGKKLKIKLSNTKKMYSNKVSLFREIKLQI